jgi:hypothetical protein
MGRSDRSGAGSRRRWIKKAPAVALAYGIGLGLTLAFIRLVSRDEPAVPPAPVAASAPVDVATLASVPAAAPAPADVAPPMADAAVESRPAVVAAEGDTMTVPSGVDSGMEPRTQPGALALALPQGPDSMGYFGKPEINGLRSIEPAMQVAMSSTVVPVTLYASATPTRWTRDEKPGDQPGEFLPWSSLEYRWTLIDNATGQPYVPPRQHWIQNPVPHINGLPEIVNPATDQIGPEVAFYIPDSGSYSIRLDARGRDENGRMVQASTSHCTRPSQYFFAVSLSGAGDLNTGNTSGTLTMTVTIPPGSSVTPGTFSHTFDIYETGLDVKAWLESVCGAENVFFEGGTVSDFHSLACVEDRPVGSPQPWPINTNLAGSHYITFVGDLLALPVTLEVTNNITVTVPDRHLGFFVQQFPYMTGVTESTITLNPFTGTERFYDSNYDGANGTSIGTELRPFTNLDSIARNGQSNTTIWFKRGSHFKVYANPTGDREYLIRWGSIQNCRWRAYGPESAPKPILGMYGGHKDSILLSCGLGPGQNFRDIVFEGLTVEPWNPDPAVNQGIPRSSGPGSFFSRLLGVGVGTAIPCWSHGVTFSDCTFRWNTCHPTPYAWAWNEEDHFSIMWSKFNCQYLMARGQNAIIGGGAPYQVYMGNRFCGGGYTVTFFHHLLYTSWAGHCLRRFDYQHHIGIDGLPYLGGTAHKANIYNSADGLPTDYLLIADCYFYGFSSSPLFAGGKNLITQAATAGHGGITCFERMHHHRPGTTSADNACIWFSCGGTKFHTVRDCHFTRVGLNPTGGRAETSVEYPDRPVSFLHFYRNHVLVSPNNSPGNYSSEMFVMGTPYGSGAYLADNVLVKQTNHASGMFAIPIAAQPKTRLRRNRFYTNHPAQFCGQYEIAPYLTLEQLQAAGIDIGSMVLPLEDFHPIDLGTDERMTVMWPAGKQRGRVARIGSSLIRVGQ